MPLLRQLGFTLLMCCSLAVAGEQRSYVVNVPTSALDGEYFADLLALVLNASKAPDERIEIRFTTEQQSQARWIASVVQGKDNSIIWTMTSTSREETLRPIRFPLMKGLMGYRALVIRKDDQGKFAKIKKPEDLIKLSAGQGMHWPDTDILRANSFSVVEAVATENLYKMLAAKRFDFFPRGIIEIPVEQEFFHSYKLVVASKILLHYPTDVYFFVNKNNTELALRLEKGWSIILKNGEFEKYFLSFDQMKSAVEFLSQHNYQLIELDNPFISEEMLTDLMRYRFEPSAK